MKKQVYVDFEATVLVPIRIKGEMTLRADDNASIEKAVEGWVSGERYSKAEVEDVSFREIIRVADNDLNDGVAEAVQQAVTDALEYGHGRVTEVTVSNLDATKE